MTKVEQNQFNMMQSVDKFFTNNQTHISNHPAIVTASSKLKSLIGEIIPLSQVQAISTKADSAIKAEGRKNIIATLRQQTSASATRQYLEIALRDYFGLITAMRNLAPYDTLYTALGEVVKAARLSKRPASEEKQNEEQEPGK